MTTDFALQAIKQLIEGADALAYPNIDGLPVYLSHEDDTRTYPSITAVDTGTEEHEVLRGVFEPLTVEVMLQSIPNDDAASGTTQELHRLMSTELYNLLGNTDAIEFLNSHTALKVFDIHGIEIGNEREDGRNSMVVTMQIVCCQQTTNF